MNRLLSAICAVSLLISSVQTAPSAGLTIPSSRIVDFNEQALALSETQAIESPIPEGKITVSQLTPVILDEDHPKHREFLHDPIGVVRALFEEAKIGEQLEKNPLLVQPVARNPKDRQMLESVNLKSPLSVKSLREKIDLITAAQLHKGDVESVSFSYERGLLVRWRPNKGPLLENGLRLRTARLDRRPSILPDRPLREWDSFDELAFWKGYSGLSSRDKENTLAAIAKALRTKHLMVAEETELPTLHPLANQAGKEALWNGIAPDEKVLWDSWLLTQGEYEARLAAQKQSEANGNGNSKKNGAPAEPAIDMGAAYRELVEQILVKLNEARIRYDNDLAMKTYSTKCLFCGILGTSRELDLDLDLIIQEAHDLSTGKRQLSRGTLGQLLVHLDQTRGRYRNLNHMVELAGYGRRTHVALAAGFVKDLSKNYLH